METDKSYVGIYVGIVHIYNWREFSYISIMMIENSYMSKSSKFIKAWFNHW